MVKLYKQAQKTLNLERSDLKMFQIQGFRGNNRFVCCSRFFCYSVSHQGKIRQNDVNPKKVDIGRIINFTGDDL